MRVVAQFKSPWRPVRMLSATLALFVGLTSAAMGAVWWEHQRLGAIRGQVAQLIEAGGVGALPPAIVPPPPYDASARQFLRERSVGWAPMLRTLESGAMVGVTPTSVQFNAADGEARVELDYADSTALIDYLGRINEGVSPGMGLARWTLVQTRTRPGAAPNAAPATPGLPQTAAAQSAATIRSTWQDEAASSGRAP